MITKILSIALGGALGSLLRAFLGTTLTQTCLETFPCNTLIINLVGCFVMGVLTQLSFSTDFFNPALRAFLVIGFLGSFTTFSAFSADAWLLIEKNFYFSALVYTILSVAGALTAFFIGIKLTKFFF